jgi:PA domain/LVIVD repeat
VKRRFVARAAAAATGAFAIAAGTAGAHPGDLFVDDGFLNSGAEEHLTYGHGAAGSVPGRLELPSGPKELGLKLVGKTTSAPEFGQLGRVADVSAKGNFAYLTMFYEPNCGRGGVQIVDISDPANPRNRGFVPSHVDTYSGEGSQVVSMNTPSFKGDLLVYQNEWCPQTTNGVGGISLIDVSNPDQPKKLVEGAGDYTKKSGAQSGGVPQTKANQTHSAFAWQSQGNGRWYVVLVDDLEEPDVDILDITNPSKPVKVAEWNLDTTAQTGPTRPHGDAVFSHDMVVKKIGGKDVMLMSYWDGGYVHLDVTDPTVAEPKILADTDFAAEDPANAIQITPEGNAHQAEFTRDNQFFFATDEDFNPFRVQAKVTGGPHAGTDFTAVQAGDAKPIDDQTSVIGPTQFLGLACSTVPAAGAAKIAVIERGVCDFQVKIDFAKAAGYTAVIVFNRTGVDGCETLVNMLAVTDIPAIFASRSDGFRILGQSLDGYTCDSTAAATGTPAPGPGPGQPVSISSVFDGWGYTHMYKATPNAAKKLEEVDFYAPPENQDPALASGYGDLSVHEVATDPDANLVYISHYALGMRVLKYTQDGLEEVGAFVEKGGSNYWGVEVHKMGGKKYILGSDRDRGLRIFEYKAGYVGDGE